MSLQSAKKRLQREGGQCAHPNCIETTTLTIDHIIPKQFLETLGFEELSRSDNENLQVLCKHHNTQKANKLDYTNVKTLPLMKKYVNMWIEKHADYFVPVEKRVYKLGVVCKCVECIVPQALDVSTWRNPPKFAAKKEKSTYKVDGYVF